MMGALSFAAPWLLVALAGLPVLYWLLRVTPPTPRRQSFPPARFLRDLPAVEETPARTPWWLLLLRMVAAALIVIGLARPVWNAAQGDSGDSPLLLVVDDGWASAPDWPDRMAAAGAALDAASRAGRRVALLPTAPGTTGEPPRPTPWMPAEEARARLAALRPHPWAPDRPAALAALEAARYEDFASLYVTDGLAHGGDDGSALMQALSDAGPLQVARGIPGMARVLLPPRAEADRLVLGLRRAPGGPQAEAAVLALTSDGRAMGRAVLPLAAGATEAEGALELPVEIRNSVTQLALEGDAPGAAGVVLLDERFRRRPVGLLAAQEEAADTPLTGALYYLDRALSPTAEIRRGTLEQLLSRRLAVLVLADRPLAEGPETEAVARFVEEGGLLLRFAGPRLAEKGDSLLPVPLRAGERALGSALSWEKPQTLAPFPEGSPFAGLTPPPEVTVSTQVLAEPVPRLAERSWARLADGTPLVTFENRGAGRIVLFHTTANADWSDLPLSGLYIDMLRRIVALSSGVIGSEGEAPLAPIETLDGFGRLGAPPPAASAITAAQMDSTQPAPRHPPGWYGTPGEGAERRALNLSAYLPEPRAAAPTPSGARETRIGGVPAERDLGPWLLAAALLLLALDLLLSLQSRGLGLRTRAVAVALALILPGAASAQEGMPEGAAALATRLAYVVTGDAQADEVSRQGLVGLSDYVNRRTAAGLAEPVALRPGRDDLSFYPLLYWVVLPDAPAPDPAAVEALNTFMRNGGIILFDTRNAGSGEGVSLGADAALRRLTRNLQVPPLAPMPDEHVLRRAFYLLPDLPGRYTGGPVWVARDTDRANDSVSPVIVGGHDWASAWAVDARGNNPYAVMPGGTRQRTLAYRFGVNLVIYALTGNYKGDQVHVPAILERLGN
ncbi:DUF4159 domain-containing protein [Roseomonas xinghualingensis]|uniref:DUF4159 domain-containing protein n=1 Tax=Roseomonas xinghualingensis TaxID=2986475 RepID=UPI0021F1A7ED|nr:DUF4159 domain-containing protein [Roseomonas sp. SXEYE001]MCV4208781.1 DUF4159 domain-containing protein [Roseomonas sp. SXEYE001]